MNDRGVGDSDRVEMGDTPIAPAAPLTASAGDAGPGHDGEGSAAEVDPCDRRGAPRLDVLWSVDCETEETFLYAAITNISEMGIFVQTSDPLAVGTKLTLRFAPTRGGEPFVLDGVVQWVNRSRPRHDSPNPGMGVRFEALTLSNRERIVDVIHTIAYLREAPECVSPVVSESPSQPPKDLTRN